MINVTTHTCTQVHELQRDLATFGLEHSTSLHEVGRLKQQQEEVLQRLLAVQYFFPHKRQTMIFSPYRI